MSDDPDCEFDFGQRQWHPRSPLERFQWLEEKCGCKREWFQKLLDLEGFEDVTKFSCAEVIDKYSIEAFRWECACYSSIGTNGLELFLSFSDDKKKQQITYYLKNWIAEQLFKKYWNW